VRENGGGKERKGNKCRKCDNRIGIVERRGSKEEENGRRK
jgi:hypothetical protein